MLLCPYCGGATAPGTRCGNCRGLLDPLSRQASQNAMGPWFVRDESLPFMPGCSYETLVGMVKRGKITRRSVLRGPTTRQFWCTAERTPGVSHLLGVCHNCRVDVQPTDSFCDECGAGFTVEPDRQHLGLGAVHVLPGQVAPVSAESAPAREPSLQEAGSVSAPAPDFAPLVHTLRAKVRRQRVAMALLLILGLGAAGALAWQYAPAELRGTLRDWAGMSSAHPSGGGAGAGGASAGAGASTPEVAGARSPGPEDRKSVV